MIEEDLSARKRRDRLHIIAEVLEVARDGTLKTQIMYKANLSFAQLNEYLALLFELNLLKSAEKNGKTVYKATQKGLRYLQSYKEIKELLKKEEESDNSPICLAKRGKASFYF